MHFVLQEAALAAARQALENARERAPVRPSYGEFVFQSRWAVPVAAFSSICQICLNNQVEFCCMPCNHVMGIVLIT